MQSKQSDASRVTAIHALLAVIAVVASIWLLQQLTVLMVPLLTALFAALVMRPVQVGVRERLPDRLGGLGTLVAAGIPVGIVVGGLAGLALTARAITPDQEQIEAWASDMQSQATAMGERLGVPIPSSVSEMPTELMSQLGSAVSALGFAGMGFVLTTFFLLLILGDLDPMGRRVRAHAGRQAAAAWVEAVTTIGMKVRVFLVMRTVAGAISATATLVLLLALGVDYAPLWALLVLMLNYIPNLGSLIAAGPPILVAALQHGPARGLAVAGGMFAIEQVVGNFIDPRLQGHKLRMSPVVVLATVVFASWLWGIGGTLLAVPCLILVLVTMEEIPALAPLAGLIREDGDSAPLVDDVEIDPAEVPAPSR